MSGVVQVVGVGYFVESKSVPGAWRLVNAAGCSCPAKALRSCRHRRAVAAHCRAVDAKFERPAGRVNAAMFVD